MTVEAPYTTFTTAVHNHKYSVDGKLPADVMRTATRDLSECLAHAGDDRSDNPGSLIEAVIDENGGMYFEWSEETEADEEPWDSNDDKIETCYIHAYVIENSSASADEIRATLDAAEKDAFKYAEANDLEYTSEIIGVSFVDNMFTAVWSTATE